MKPLPDSTPAVVQLNAPPPSRLSIAIWATFIMLSIAIFSYPVHLTLDFDPVQSVIVLVNLPLFGGLFYAWTALLLIILLRRHQEGNWQRVFALVIFTVISLGLWIAATHGEIREAPLYAAQIDAIKDQHHIVPQSPNFAYFQWPSAFFQVATISTVTGVPTWGSIVVIELIWNATFAVFLYLFFLASLEDHSLACLGVPLILFGSVQTYKLLQQFHPGTLGMILYLVAFTLLIHSMRHSKLAGANKLLLSIVVASLVATHFVTSVALLLVTAILTMLQRFRSDRLTELDTVFVSFAITLAWLLYVAGQAAGDLLHGARNAFTQMFSGSILPGGYFRSMGSAYFGGGVPIWVRVIRSIWFGGIYGLGGLRALLWAVRYRKLRNVQLANLGLVAAAGTVGVIAYLLTRGEDTVRLLTYAPFPLVAVLLGSLTEKGQRVEIFAAWGLLLVIFALSLPSFLINSNTVNLDNYSQRAEEHAGRFLERSFGKGESLILNASLYPWIYHIPFASFRPSNPHYVDYSQEQFLSAIQQDARSFIASEPIVKGTRIWVSTTRDILNIKYRLSINLLETRGWRGVEAILTKANRVYDNGGVDFYTPPGATASRGF